MKRLPMILATVVLLSLGAASTVNAKAAHAAPVAKELVKSGPASVARDWAPEGKPGPEDTLTVPAGKTLEVTKLLETHGLTVNGTIARSQNTIKDSGAFVLDAPVAWEGQLVITGFGRFASGGNTISNLQDEGAITLTEPLTAGVAEWTGTIATQGWPLTVGGLAYPLQNSTSNYGASTVTSGEWLDYEFNDAHSIWIWQYSSSASFVVNGDYHTTFKGAGDSYGSVMLASPVSVFSGDNYTVEGAWCDSTPVLTFEPSHTVTVNGAVDFEPAASSVSSSVPGRSYTIQLPGPQEATTSATVSDMHVVGGPLTLHGATDGGGNEGVVFVP